MKLHLSQNSKSIIREKILDIYGEHKKLPNRIQDDLSFSDYVDFHLDQQNKMGNAKSKYLEVVQDLLARVHGKNVQKEFLENHDQGIEVLEKEEQSTTIYLQPSSDHVEDVTQGTIFYVGELKVSVDKQANEDGCT